MFGLCLESSHARGMGHLFRQLHFSALLAEKGVPFRFFINEDPVAVAFLSERRLPFETVDLQDQVSQWEKTAVKKHGIRVWVDDRLDTDAPHGQTVKATGATLAVFDDHGGGAALADFNFCAFAFATNTPIPGKRVFRGVQYLVLNREIDAAKRLRQALGKIVVTLGGSDTYNATEKIIALLKSVKRTATVILGPSFKNPTAVEKMAGADFTIKRSVKSLVAEFAGYDLAICGGGITPFEANAAGLPCVIVANEAFEIPNGLYLQKIGSSVYAGPQDRIDPRPFAELSKLDLAAMSRAGQSHLDTQGAARIYEVIARG